MNLDNVPAELRALRQWVVWRPVTVQTPDGDRVTKPPYDPNAPERKAAVDDPGSWGTFEQARKMYEANPGVFGGVGFIFTEGDEFFGLDIDDEAKVQPEHLEARRNFVQQVMTNFKTYAELSPSGQGMHMIGRGNLPVAGRRSTPLQFEVYCSQRYFTITGDVLEGRTQILDQQELLVQLFGALTPDNTTMNVSDTNAHRRLDLSDLEVIRLATNFNPTFAPRFNAQVGCQPGEWSDTFMAIVGMIDRFTGSVEQIERIVLNSPMVMLAPPSGTETRLAKAKRTLHDTLARVRRGNNGLLHFAEHGRQMIENIERAKAQRAVRAAEALAAAEAAVAGMSKGSQSVLDAFPQLDKGEHKLLTRPPGLVGEFVLATEKASFKPFTKFAIPATLATLAGIVGRGFKLPGGSGLNVNFILAAPSNTGKTQSMLVWERFVSDALSAIGNTLTGPASPRIVNSSTSSIQGMMDTFVASPSIVWYVEECYSQLSAMTDGKGPSDAQLRDAFNQLYDTSRHGAMFSGPKSVASRNAKLDPINNLSVSTYWTTTTSKFDVFTEDALDGFLSRVVVIRHQAPGGEPVQYPEIQLRPDLRDVLVQRLASAKQLDELYKLNSFEAYKTLTVVSVEQIAELHWEFVRTVDAIANAAITGRLPPVYGAISRLPLTAQRISAMMAVIENPFSPSVTLEQYKWTFGYLLQNLVSLLTDVDVGELGSGSSDETLAVVKALKELIKKQPKGTPGVARQLLRDHLKHRKPFNAKRDFGPGSSKRVSDTIDFMLKEGMLEEFTGPSDGRGRPPAYLSPVLSDPIWGQTD